MSAVRIYVATRDGQSERIARHVARRLADRGVVVEHHVLSQRDAVRGILVGARVIVLIAAVRYGRHLREADAFLDHYRTTDPKPPLAFASVNLSARKQGKQSVCGNPYLRKILERHGLRPEIAFAIAGRLDYPRYRWFDRQMIRLIMAITGGPTDRRASVEYTQWKQVDDFADAIAELVTGTGGRR